VDNIPLLCRSYRHYVLLHLSLMFEVMLTAFLSLLYLLLTTMHCMSIRVNFNLNKLFILVCFLTVLKN
jgi:hypothetical protein